MVTLNTLKKWHRIKRLSSSRRRKKDSKCKRERERESEERKSVKVTEKRRQFVCPLAWWDGTISHGPVFSTKSLWEWCVFCNAQVTKRKESAHKKVRDSFLCLSLSTSFLFSLSLSLSWPVDTGPVIYPAVAGGGGVTGKTIHHSCN